MPAIVRFVFRTGCSLCDAMWTELADYVDRRKTGSGSTTMTVERIDLAEHPALEAEYGRRVPVLEADGREICHYFFDEEALASYLSRPPIAVS